MFKRSTPESRVQARKDAVIIGATQVRVQARVQALQARVMASPVLPPVAITGGFSLMILAAEWIESINL